MNTNEWSDKKMVQLLSIVSQASVLSEASVLAQQIDILQRAMRKIDDLFSAQSSTRCCSSGEDSYSKTGPGPGDL